MRGKPLLCTLCCRKKNSSILVVDYFNPIADALKPVLPDFTDIISRVKPKKASAVGGLLLKIRRDCLVHSRPDHSRR